MGLKVNERRQIIDTDTGQPVVGAGGAPLVIDEGVVGQSVMDRVLQERLAKAEQKAQAEIDAAKKRAEEADLKLLELNELQTKSAQSKEDLERLKREKQELETRLADSQVLIQKRAREAEEAGRAAIEAANARNSELQSRLKDTILRNAVERASRHPGGQNIVFRDPSDLLGKILPHVEWEDVVDEAGKPTGELKFVVNMPVFDKDLKQERKRRMTVAEAAVHVAETCDWYVEKRGFSGIPSPTGPSIPGAAPILSQGSAPMRARDLVAMALDPKAR